MELTGNFRYRSNMFGKLILQVEYSKVWSSSYDVCYENTELLWRDAKVQDLTLIQLAIDSKMVPLVGK